MSKRAVRILAVLLGLAACAAFVVAQDKVQTWTGEISDAMCAGNHAAMGGANARDCTLECIKSMGSKYALVVDSKTAYELSDQKSPEAFAGKKARVTGVLDAKTKVIRVQKIEAAK